MQATSRQDGVRELFDETAATYDRVNSVVSLGLDSRWRDWAAHRAVTKPGARILDAFSGTGRTGLRAARLGARVTLADVSPGMLAIAHDRARREKLDVRTVVVDLVSAPGSLAAGPFDAVTVVFGVRYLDDPEAVLTNLGQLLRPGGRLVVVEFNEPDHSAISRVAGAYFFHVIPPVAGALSGHRELYDRLAAGTHEMGGTGRLVSIVSATGLVVEDVHHMGFGLVTGVVAEASP
jgi:demethylmenaquinone methyltransferase / 2-methoxy-6-polyprenyl-1,4-benzoquinol methylase